MTPEMRRTILVNEMVEQGGFYKSGEITEAQFIAAVNHYVDQCMPEVPEGCTPADAQMLRRANHALADENDQLRKALQAAQREVNIPGALPGCHCETCRPNTWGSMRMILCAKCGNKRCPHAHDHRNACTNSNEPGQSGSSYPA